MTLQFECTVCGKKIPFKAPATSDQIEIIDVTCPHCDSVYTVECYYENGKYLGFQEFDYGWYEEHGDEDFMVNI